MECMVLAISALVFFVVSSIGYNKGKEADAKERKIEYISGKKKVQNEKEGEKSSKDFSHLKYRHLTIWQIEVQQMLRKMLSTNLLKNN